MSSDIQTENGVSTDLQNQIREAAREAGCPAPSPTSVYRLQLNRQFTLREATSVLPYLGDLGADALYLSPIFESVPGSMHGYDIVNPNRINPELGGEEAFGQFCDAMRHHGLRLILDVVPNHMGIQSDLNLWWNDVLENGESSRHAHYFDIDWEPVKKDLTGKVLLPVLGDSYGIALENQDLGLKFTGSAFTVRLYGERELPIAPDTYAEILEDEMDSLKAQLGEEHPDFLEYMSISAGFRNLPDRTERDPGQQLIRNREKEVHKRRLGALAEKSVAVRSFIAGRVENFNGRKGDSFSFDLLDRLLNLQSFRLAFWRVASEEINYRRFFDINELAALRIEDQDVFENHHRLVFSLLEQDRVQGLRIDHPDGLYDPVAYFQNLQRKFHFIKTRKILAERGIEITQEIDLSVSQILEEEEFSTLTPLYVVAEKILDRTEEVPTNWHISGTVGYEYLNALNGILVARHNEKAITSAYEAFTREKLKFETLLYEKKKFFAAFYMSSEVNTLAHRLDSISEKIRRYRDFTLSSLTTALREVIACFPVYRTYIRPDDSAVSERDEKYIRQAIERAKRKHPTLSRTLFDFLEQILLGKFEAAFSDQERREFRDFVLRFQQLTAPIMAKGLEDTVFYVFNRLTSLNEVGGDPEHFGYSLEEFHRQNLARRQKWPRGIITSATHDTKRSEDVRMRINVLSEIPAEWEAQVEWWAGINRVHKTLLNGVRVPTRNTEYFIYQTLIGIWPIESLGPEDHAVLVDRLWNYFLKAAREAKVFTHWLKPNEEYEAALRKFLTAILSPDEKNQFLHGLPSFQKRISEFGMLNSLSALVLKTASPGVFDQYQGTGSWDYSLVDPDNRRPVDFELRRNQLAQVIELERSEQPNREGLAELLQSKEDGRIKRYLLWKGLHLRKKYHQLFLDGDYVPLSAEGRRHSNIVAFMRRHEDKMLIVACARFYTEIFSKEKKVATGNEVWENTLIRLPGNLTHLRLTDVFTGQNVSTRVDEKGVGLPVSEVFGTLPFALLTNADLD